MAMARMEAPIPPAAPAIKATLSPDFSGGSAGVSSVGGGSAVGGGEYNGDRLGGGAIGGEGGGSGAGTMKSTSSTSVSTSISARVARKSQFEIVLSVKYSNLSLSASPVTMFT